MASQIGQLTSYQDTVPDKRMVTDRILRIEPYDIVAYSYLGTDMGKFNFTNRDNKTYEWLESTYNDRTDTVNSGLASDSTTTTFSATDADLYQIGDVWECEGEGLLVTGKSTTTMTIVRNIFGTQATHANSSVITRVSRARLDGATADDSPRNEVASASNVTQIFQRTIEIARTKGKIAEYGVSDWTEYWIDQYMDELMMDLARAPYLQERNAGSASQGRLFGGFPTFITDNITYATSTAATGGTALALARSHVDSTLTNIFADGGDPDLMLTTAHAQRKINDMYEGFVSTERSEQLGGVLIKKLQNPITGKYIDVAVDRNCPAGQLHILTTKNIAYYPFDPFFYENLAKTKDTSGYGQVVGEYGMVISYDKSHGAVKEFSSTL
jgi:Family of unknown function (DUF5309)